jgi:purine-binding chemotaxis protein CheW
MNNSRNNVQSHLLIQLADETYAINVTKVYQIFEVPPITRVPQTPPFMLGVMNARDRMLPVIDLRVLYDIEVSEKSKHTAIIATACNLENENGGLHQDVGLLVDTVHEVADIDCSQIERPAMPGNVGDYSCFAGFVRLGDKIVMVLDVDHLLNTEALAQLKTFISNGSSV